MPPDANQAESDFLHAHAFRNFFMLSDLRSECFDVVF